IDFLFQVIGFLALTFTVEFIFTNWMKNMGVSIPLVHVGKLPLLAQFLIFFIIMDFCQFFAHFLLHRIDFFWKFHKIHHAQETLGFASTRHFHIMEYLVLRPFGWIPMGLIGYNEHSYIICTALYMWIAYFLVFFSHCNVKINFGILNKIIITPNTHYWHHAKNIPRKYGVNYASVLVIWDFLFRSFYLPEDPKLQPILGVPDNDVPKGFFGQLIYPFKTLFTKKKDAQMMNVSKVKAKK
ncbi:MAG TPA: sterol desaturase family protein, partial [Bacteroidia bacterium]|nr:sterol desaturase family protein [Bacteroidia bacterium]